MRPIPSSLRHATLVVLALQLFAAQVSVAQERVYGDVPDWTGPVERTVSIALGDVDGDGDLDLVRGNDNDHTTLYVNVGGTFDEHPAWEGPVGPTYSVALGDVDNDGDLDLVRGNFAQGAALHLNTGQTFADDPIWTGRVENTRAIALGDVDGDGRLDLVRGNLDQGPSLYLNIGSSFSEVPAWSGLAEATWSVALGDIDGDGDLDLVCGNANQTATLYLNNGGTFGSPTPIGAAENTWSVALGDVDSDGLLDLVRGNLNQGATLYLNRGGRFPEAPDWVGPVENTTSIALGDVDGDGDLDLVRGNSNQGATLYMNQDGMFSSTYAWIGPSENNRSIALADVDGDGALDLVRGSSNSGATLYRNVVGSFGLKPAWTAGTEVSLGVALADVDGNGALDLVRGNYDQPATLYLNAGGLFSTTSDWSGPSEKTRSIAVGDVDGDGHVDLVRGNNGGGSTLYRNVGGTFAQVATWTGQPEDTWSIALGDLDGDGDLDLVCGNAGEGSTVYGNTRGTFEPSPAWRGQAENTRGIALGDVDGDGRLDLVCGNLFQRATLYRNVEGRFEAMPTLVGQVENTRCVALGDVDGDGDLDMVRGNSEQGTTLYLNSGGMFESSPVWTGPVENTWCIALADVDGDGDLDVICGNVGEPTTVHLNVNGRFDSNPTWSGPSEGTRSIALGDVNGDGDTDLVRGNEDHDATLYTRRTAWLSDSTGKPLRRLPNNPAHLRDVRIDSVAINRYRILFHAFDVEDDPVWLKAEFQLQGTPRWTPMDFEAPAGPFTTSSQGIEHTIDWNVAGLPIDRRNVIVRIRAYSPPRRAGIIQFEPSYITPVGRVVPRRPVIVSTQASLTFPTLTVGDSASLALDISNAGNEDLVIDRIDPPYPELLPTTQLPLVLVPGQGTALDMTLAPRGSLAAVGLIRIRCNDPASPILEIPVRSDVRPLEVRTQLITPGAELPLGEAATVVVTPAPGVHVEGGFAYYRPRGVSQALADSTPLGLQGSIFVAVIPGHGVTEAGLEYYVRVENSGLFASDPPAAPTTTFYYPVSSPQAISVLAQADLTGDYPVGRPTPVIVSLPNGSEFSSGTLFFRAGGKAAYDSLPLEPGEVSPGEYLPIVVIPGEALGPRGLEYWVRVHTLTRTLTAPNASPAHRPITLRTNVPTLEEGRTHPGNRYYLMSVPLELSVPERASLEAILSDQPEFGSYDARRWRAYRYMTSLGRYLEISEAPTAHGGLRPEPGRAFWLIARAENRIETAPIAGRSTPTDMPYRILLEPGWNQIANPFLFPVEWSQIVVEGHVGSVPLTPPVAWDPMQEKYQDADVDVLQPFEGYWLRNPDRDPLTLLIPPHEASTPSLESRKRREGPAVDPTTWRLQLTVEAGTASDTRNFIGAAGEALDGPDSFDRPDPPLVPGSATSLYFVGTESTSNGDGGAGRLTTDIRSPVPETGPHDTRGQRWFFDVRCTGGQGWDGEVQLRFEGVDQVPRHVQLRLFDRSLRTGVNLRRQTSYIYASGPRDFVTHPHDARFEIVAGSEEFVQTAGTDLSPPERRTQLLPFSNPVRALTVIRFETALAGHVSIQVLDSEGRRMRTLLNAERGAGLHEVAWRGDDDLGRQVAPGVYFLQLIGPDRAEARKVVRLR